MNFKQQLAALLMLPIGVLTGPGAAFGAGVAGPDAHSCIAEKSIFAKIARLHLNKKFKNPAEFCYVGEVRHFSWIAVMLERQSRYPGHLGQVNLAVRIDTQTLQVLKIYIQK